MLNFTIQELTQKEVGENQALKRHELPKNIQEILPKANQEITPLLASRFGLELVPPILKELAEKGHNLLCPGNMSRVNIGTASCCLKAGTKSIADKLSARTDFQNKVIVKNTGCKGLCFAQPLVDVRIPDGTHYIFGKVGSDSLWPIINIAKQTSTPQGIWAILKEKEPGIITGYQDLTVEKIFNTQLSDYLDSQTKRITGNWGLLDPGNIAEYIATGGYFALAQILFSQDSDTLRRLLFDFVAQHKPDISSAVTKYAPNILVIADEENESVHRELLENDPHRILESICLLSIAMGFKQAYILVGPNQTLAANTLQKAVNDTLKEGIIGDKVLGSDYSFHINILQSTDSLACSELDGPLLLDLQLVAKASLIYSPDAKLLEGGVEKSASTEFYYLTGDAKQKGFIEVLPDVNIRTIVEKISGTSSLTVKALQFGQVGEIIPYSNLDSALDFRVYTGHENPGSIRILNKSRCIVKVARDTLNYLDDKICRECSVCRDELKTLLQMLNNLTQGNPAQINLKNIQDLWQTVLTKAICTTGKSSVNLINSTITNFENEYIAHIEGKCPALSCKDLIYYIIDPTKCKDCRCCYLVCPSHAITKHEKGYYSINNKLCNGCGICVKKCPFGCIELNS